MISNNDKISIRQMKMLLILNLFGMLVLTLPRVTAEYAGTDAWILIILATIFAFFYAYVIGTLTMRFPNDTFVEYTQKIIGKFFGIVLSLCILGYFLIYVSMEVRTFGEVNKQFLLDATPIEFIIITILLTAAYLVRKGYECRARFAEIIFFFVFIPLFLVMAFVLFEADFTNLKPSFNTSFYNILKGSYLTSLSFIGLIFILLVVPYSNNPRKIRKSILQVVGIVGILHLITVVVCIARFGVRDTQNLIWPVLSLMQSVRIPRVFIERQEGLIMIFWILAIFTVIHSFLYAASLTLCRIFKTKEHNFFVLPLIVVIYFLSLQPNNVPQVYTWISYIIRYIAVWFLFPIPIILLLIAKLRKLGVNTN